MNNCAYSDAIFLSSNLRQNKVDSSVRTENLSLSYRGKPALENINLEIKKGCITALVGPSGCGKSSFLFSLNRLTDLIPGCAVSGKVEIEGINVFNKDADVGLLRRKVGLIFQKPNPFPISVKSNIEIALKEHGVKDKMQRMAIVENVLQQTGLWNEVKDRLDSSALSLSGGQQQRLCIARALALKPDIVLLDEPCSALDPISGGVVEDLILGLKNQYTILTVTHNLAQARRISDFTALFWVQNGCGNLIEYGPTSSFFEKPENELTYSYIKGMRG